MRRTVCTLFLVGCLIATSAELSASLQTEDPPSDQPAEPVEAAAEPSEEAIQGADGSASTASSESPISQLRSTIFVLMSQAEGFVATAEARDPITKELRALIDQTQELIAEADRANSISSMTELEQLQARLLDTPLRLHQALRAGPTKGSPAGGGTRSPRPEGQSAGASPGPRPGRSKGPPPTIPGGLRDAAENFFDGEYQDALQGVGGVQYKDSRIQAKALLLRSAARYSLFLMAGDEDKTAEMLDAVTGDIQECGRLAPFMRPDPDLFSPRFIRFFSAQNPQPSR